MNYVDIPYHRLIQPNLCFALNGDDADLHLLRFSTTQGDISLGFSSVDGFAEFFDTHTPFVELDIASAVSWLERENLDLGFDFHAEHAAILPLALLNEIASSLSAGSEISFDLDEIKPLDNEPLKDRLNIELAHLAKNSDFFLANVQSTPTVFAVHRVEDPSALAAKLWPILARVRETSAVGFVPLSVELANHQPLISRLHAVGSIVATVPTTATPPILR